jgi:polysaccharide export outer membrane protein
MALRAQTARPESAAAPARREPSDYIIGPRDVLSVIVRNQPSLTNRVTVEADGTVSFALIGRLTVAGLTARGLEDEMGKRLTDGFLKNPEISVTVEEYRSQRVVVMGEVQQPGPYPLTGRTMLLEVLAVARATAAAAKEAIIVRPAKGGAAVPAPSPDEPGDSEVIRVDLNALETGNLAGNILVRDGDTIFIPRAGTVVVFGQVRSPGVYAIQRDTTLYTVLALAGGVTDRGTMSRIKVLRTVNGKQRQISLKPNDVVQAGDTIVAQERLF